MIMQHYVILIFFIALFLLSVLPFQVKAASISGNYAIIGAYFKTVGGTINQGQSCIFQNIGGVWQPYQTIKTPGGSAYNLLGETVVITSLRFLITAPGVQANRGMAFL
jgi:hypothetical protein